MEKKITKKDRFVEMRAFFEELERTDLVEFINHEIELLDKKSASKSKKEIANANVNAELMQIVKEVLENTDKAMTVSEVMKANEVLAELSNQKVSYLMRTLVENKDVTKFVEKGKSYFRIAFLKGGFNSPNF
jgi:hypothetical protein